MRRMRCNLSQLHYISEITNIEVIDLKHIGLESFQVLATITICLAISLFLTL